MSTPHTKINEIDKNTENMKKKEHEHTYVEDDRIENILSKVDCPLFLHKTYNMVNTGNPNIIRWSNDGTFIIIQDPGALVSSVLPNFFRHDNIQSFIRQLNSYGFGKIKPKNHQFDERNNKTKRSKYLCFSHQFFIKGKPELLRNIHKNKKPSKNSCTGQHEIENIESDIKSLKNTVGNMVKHMEQLKESFIFSNDLMKENTKRRRDLLENIDRKPNRRRFIGNDEIKCIHKAFGEPH